MRKRWIASFVAAIVVLAGAAALITLGFVQMTPRVHATKEYTLFGTFQISSYTTSNANLGNNFVFLGGILVVAGILLFILAEVIRSHEECCDCCDSDFIEAAEKECCCCDKSEEKTEEKPVEVTEAN